MANRLIDLSSHQGILDRVPDDTVAILRCGRRGWGTGGSIGEDICFKHNAKLYADAGRLMGVYFYSQAITLKEAEEEAIFAAKLVEPFIGSTSGCGGLIFIDSELTDVCPDGRADDLSDDMRTAIVERFCETIENLGLKAGIYCSEHFATQVLDMKRLRKNGRVIWIAKWNNAAPDCFYDIWQYSAKGQIDGIEKDVDLNVIRAGFRFEYRPKVSLKVSGETLEQKQETTDWKQKYENLRSGLEKLLEQYR